MIAEETIIDPQSFRARALDRIRQLAEERGHGEWERITSPADDAVTDLDDVIVAVDRVAAALPALRLVVDTLGPEVLAELAPAR